MKRAQLACTAAMSHPALPLLLPLAGARPQCRGRTRAAAAVLLALLFMARVAPVSAWGYQTDPIGSSATGYAARLRHHRRTAAKGAPAVAAAAAASPAATSIAAPAGPSDADAADAPPAGNGGAAGGGSGEEEGEGGGGAAAAADSIVANATTIAQILDRALDKEFAEETHNAAGAAGAAGKTFSEAASSEPAAVETVVRISSGKPAPKKPGGGGAGAEGEDGEDSSGDGGGGGGEDGGDSADGGGGGGDGGDGGGGGGAPDVGGGSGGEGGGGGGAGELPSVEVGVDRIIDSHDNEFVLSAPKSGSVASLTLDPRLVQDLTCTLGAAAALGALFEVRGAARRGAYGAGPQGRGWLPWCSGAVKGRAFLAVRAAAICMDRGGCMGNGSCRGAGCQMREGCSLWGRRGTAAHSLDACAPWTASRPPSPGHQAAHHQWLPGGRRHGWPRRPAADQGASAGAGGAQERGWRDRAVMAWG
jgi:hypothetical protein